MLSAESKYVLENQGWFPERRADTGDWAMRLRAEGFHLTTEWEAVLTNLGGLLITPPLLPGSLFHPSQIYFDPVQAAGGEHDLVRLWQKHLGVQLSPLGELSGEAMLFLTDSGEVVYTWSNAVFHCGMSFDEAMNETLLVGRRHASIRNLTPEGRLVHHTAR